jgi:hypothetical protein
VLACQGEQVVVDRFEELVLVDVFLERDLELVGDREHQAARLDRGILDESGDEAFVEGRHELAAQERLAGSNLSRDADEALAVPGGNQQRVKGLLRLRRAKKKLVSGVMPNGALRRP